MTVLLVVCWFVCLFVCLVVCLFGLVWFGLFVCLLGCLFVFPLVVVGSGAVAVVVVAVCGD